MNKNVMNNTKVIYNGQSNPYRKGSKEWNEFTDQRDWWFNNLNLSIITDYLKDLEIRNLTKHL